MRQVKSGKDRKTHEFKTKNANGKNNTKPIIYTPEYVLKQLKSMLKRIKKDKDPGGLDLIIFKLQLFEDKPYTEQRLSEWADKYKNDEKISDACLKINEILKSRAWVGGMRGLLNAPMTKFHLMSNYGVKDQAVDVNVQHILMREIIKKSKDVQ